MPDSFECRFTQRVKKLTIYLTVLWPQIPKSDCLVQWSREKWIVDRGHIQGDNSDNTHKKKKNEWNTYMYKCKYNVQNGKYYRCIFNLLNFFILNGNVPQHYLKCKFLTDYLVFVHFCCLISIELLTCSPNISVW